MPTNTKITTASNYCNKKNKMKKLSKNEMKNILGGAATLEGCKAGETTWHCTVGSGYPGSYICQGAASSGGCGNATNCRAYCQTSSGTTYWT